MKVTVRFFASLREAVGTREQEVEVSEGTTLGDLLTWFAGRYPQLAELAPRCLLAINREFADRETPLQERDEVAFLPPVSGGEAPIPALFEITEREISVEGVAGKVEDDRQGAVVTFAGLVRRYSRGKRVRYLEYEAYPEMAIAKMAAIAGEIEAKWGIDRVAITHRIGRLELGETSIVIAVAAPHRHAAFEACHYAINRLKLVVPVWKKEVWEDGEVWVGLEDDGAYAARRPTTTDQRPTTNDR